MVEAEVEEQLSSLSPAVISWKSVSFSLFRKHLLRIPHECRERWINHLDPTITKRKWTPQEDLCMLSLYREHGHKWSLIARLVSNRNEHMIKNRFNSLRAKLFKKHPSLERRFKVELMIEELKNAVVMEEPVAVLNEKEKEEKIRSKGGSARGSHR
jgi:hypothetical protein